MNLWNWKRLLKYQTLLYMNIFSMSFDEVLERGVQKQEYVHSHSIAYITWSISPITHISMTTEHHEWLDYSLSYSYCIKLKLTNSHAGRNSTIKRYSYKPYAFPFIITSFSKRLTEKNVILWEECIITSEYERISTETIDCNVVLYR
jgi:hypothetical protein